jgi:hypothetical protein
MLGSVTEMFLQDTVYRIFKYTTERKTALYVRHMDDIVKYAIK